MQNKTPIVVLTGLAIVAAAAVAWLARGQWMAPKIETVATAPAPEAPKTPTQPATTTAEATQPATTAPAPSGQAASTSAPATTEQEAAPAPATPATTEQPAAPAPATPATPEQPAAAAPATPATPEQPAAAAPATPATPEQPATTTAGTAAQPDSMAADTTEQPSTEAPKSADTSQQTAEAQPEQPPAANTAAAKVPAFDTVRVEKTGEAVIAGTAAPGADVVVKLDGKVIGETTANSDGAFVIVPTAPLPAGSGALTLESKAPGAAEATVSQQSVAVILPATGKPQEALVAIVSPDQPTRVLQKPEVKQDATAPATTPAAGKPAVLVSIDAVDYDAAGNIVFSGQGNEGNTARVYIDNNFLGDAPVGPDGHWTFSATAQVTPGVHTLRVDGLDSAGKVLNRVEVPFVREEQKKVADATQQQAQSGSSAKTGSENTQQAGQQPAAQQQPAAIPAKPKDGRVVIQPGNNLWTIARVLYGSGAKFTMLYEANKDQIRDPDRIYPGQIFKTPDVAAKLESIDPKRRAPLKPEENAVTDQ